MNEPQEKAFFSVLMIGTSFFFVLGLIIVVTFFTGHYLDLALPVVKKIYGTQESVPVAYDRGLNLDHIRGHSVILVVDEFTIFTLPECPFSLPLIICRLHHVVALLINEMAAQPGSDGNG